MPDSFRQIRDFKQLLTYLGRELDWPVDDLEVHNVDDLTFDYTADELGLDPKTAAKIKLIKQLRPLSSSQPWGIFYIQFEPKKLPVVALRRILSKLVLKRRASANQAERASWQLHDLLFISNYGEGEGRQLDLAHFSESPARPDLPTLKVLGWDGDDTALKLAHVENQLRAKLRWPDNPDDVPQWRKAWAAAFELRPREIITTAQALATKLAVLAKSIREQARQVLAVESDRGPVRKLFNAFREALIHDLDEDDFADMYAQTITYGLFSAAVSRTTEEGTPLLAENLVDMVPITNPFLREMLSTFLTVGGKRDKFDFDELGVNDVVTLLRSPDTKLKDVLRDFGNRGRGEDPVIHFYEDFLKQYDKKRKVERGVFYTPQPVVSYIVRSVHELLQTEFGLEDGLASTVTWGEMAAISNLKSQISQISQISNFKIPAGTSPSSPFVTILDPATGTATFLVEVIDVIHKTMTAKWQKARLKPAQQQAEWNKYVPQHLLPRLFGYELMMAPYAIAHMKIGLKLGETGYKFGSDQRARIFLTNALEPPRDDQQKTLGDWFPALAHEAEQVNDVKRRQRFTVVVGNPPYAGWSANLTPEARALVEAYKYLDGERIREKGALQFEKNLQDDYVKFIAWSEAVVNASGAGVLAMISNHGYLETPTLRGMRNHILKTFPIRHFLELHGSTKRPREGDENVFDIQQGVAVTLLANPPGSVISRTQRAEVVGARETKNRYLADNSAATTGWTAIKPSPPLYQFLPLDSDRQAEYAQFIPLPEIMPFYSTGTETGFDSLMVDFTRSELLAKLRRFLDTKKDATAVEQEFSVGEGTSRKLLEMRKEFRRDFEANAVKYCQPGMYRVFDTRVYYYKKEYLKTNSLNVMQHLLEGDNLALVAFRQQSQDGFQHAFVTRQLGDKNAVSLRTREINYYFPLHLRAGTSLGLQSDSVNFARYFVERASRLVQSPSLKNGRPKNVEPRELFCFIYAVLHCPSYRNRYSDFLKSDFPRVPAPSSATLILELSELGSQLVSFHLLESPLLKKNRTKFKGKDAEVEKVSWSDDTVWIDKGQSVGFVGVPQDVWEFHIGGYQVCQKWLKDRKGRTLSAEDIEHYHKIVVALSETIRLMGEIDAVIERHGGWPGAFAVGAPAATADA